MESFAHGQRVEVGCRLTPANSRNLLPFSTTTHDSGDDTDGGGFESLTHTSWSVDTFVEHADTLSLHCFCWTLITRKRREGRVCWNDCC